MIDVRSTIYKSRYMILLSWTNPLTNRVTRPLGVRRLTAMRTSCKFEGISDALPLGEIEMIIYFALLTESTHKLNGGILLNYYV